MGGLLALLYGVISYLIFFGSFLYAIAFLGNLDGPFITKTIDSGTPGGLIDAIVVNSMLLTIFAFQHTVMARPGFKAQWTRFIPESIERSTYVLLSSLILILLFWQWRPMTDVVWSTSGMAATALTVLYALGWAFLLYATFLINHFELFGLSQVFARLRNKEFPQLTFVMPVLYKFVRHPIMLGWLIIFWAAPTMTTGHLLFTIATTAYILIAIPIEERDLVDHIGEDYVAYQNSVPMILPFGKGGSEPAKGVSET
jgi:protein-S-isoprenylcysteine O-methyltransferase Ste14